MRSLGFKHIFTLILLTIMLVVGGIDVVKGQCLTKTRTYANFQGKFEKGTGILIPITAGSVNNESAAIDGNFNTHSNLSVPVAALNLASAAQYLEFTEKGTHATRRDIAPNTEVTVKFTLPKELIGLISGLSIGTFVNLKEEKKSWPLVSLGNGQNAGYSGMGEVEFFTTTSLLNLLNGTGEFEVSFTPTAIYSGVYLKLSSVLSLGLSSNLFHAYIMEDNPDKINCDKPIDVLSGVKATGNLGIANITGRVDNPQNSIDEETTIPTFTYMDAGAQVLSKTFETIIFNKPSEPGDSIRLVLKGGNNGLIELDLLGNFTIQPYLKNTVAGLPFLSNSNVLDLKLLPGSSELTVVTMPVGASFDRVEISMMGLTNLSSRLSIYDVKLIKPTPVIDLPEIIGNSSTVCQGQTLSLVEPQISTCITYSWYQIGKIDSIGTGTSITLPPLDPGTHTFVVKANRTGCNETSESLPFKITVNDISPGTISGDQTICSGLSPNITSLSPGIASDNLTYQWQQSTDHSNFVDIANEVNENLTTITPLILATSYRRIAYSTLNGKICSAISNTVKVTITPPPTISNIVVPSTRKHCVGVGLTYSVPINANGDIGTWTSSDPAIAKILDSERIGSMDNVFLKGISAGKINLIYTVENEATGCITSTSEEVTIFALPSITLGAIPAICEEQSQATLPYTASSENTLEYSIIWDNFPDTDYQPLPVSPISLSIPASASHGTYSGSFIIINKNGCTDSQRISITINPKPGPPHINITIN